MWVNPFIVPVADSYSLLLHRWPKVFANHPSMGCKFNAFRYTIQTIGVTINLMHVQIKAQLVMAEFLC
jgi:hypothetical protein